MQNTLAGAATRASKPLSRRIEATDTPVIDFTRRIMARRKDALSLAQGIVHWGPPPAALASLTQRLAADPTAASAYAPNEGLPALRAALRDKVAQRNGLTHYDVTVTPGCNQAFMNAVLSLVDASQRVALFTPYYFDHLMALQMTGSADRVLLGPCDAATMRPSLDWLRAALAAPDPPALVVVVNPCNPTGVLLSRSELDSLSAACAAGGAWLVVDNTYEDFVFEEGGEHYCPAGPHVVHLFSMSKAYGMMGWRIGYVAFPDYHLHNADMRDPPPGGSAAASALAAAAARGAAAGAMSMAQLKVQDAVCICAPQPSQLLALEALRGGDEYVHGHIEALRANRALLRSALAPLEPHVHGGEGAIYWWARLPPAATAGGADDRSVVEWLVEQAGVCVIPGSSCGMPGYIRCSFANLPPARFPAAVERLRAGLEHLAAEGLTPMRRGGSGAAGAR